MKAFIETPEGLKFSVHLAEIFKNDLEGFLEDMWYGDGKLHADFLSYRITIKQEGEAAHGLVFELPIKYGDFRSKGEKLPDSVRKQLIEAMDYFNEHNHWDGHATVSGDTIQLFVPFTFSDVIDDPDPNKEYTEETIVEVLREHPIYSDIVENVFDEFDKVLSNLGRSLEKNYNSTFLGGLQ